MQPEVYKAIRRGLLLVIAMAALPAWGDVTRGGWRRARPILLPALPASRLVYLPLDEEALAGVEMLAEYRIVRSGRGETPYRMVEERGQTETYALEAKVISQSAPGSEPEEVILDLGVRPPSRLRIALELPGNDFRCRAQVEGSRDQQQWRSIMDQGSVFRQAGGVEQKEIVLPSQDFRFLRIRLFPLKGTLPRIGQVKVSSEVTVAQRLLPVAATLSRREIAGERRTVIELDPGRQTRDLAEARFEVSEVAFDRPVTVETLWRGKEWEERPATGTLRRLAPGGEVTLPLEIPQTRRLRFSIFNGDDPPLTIRRVTLWRVRRGLIFSAEPGQKYELWYDRPDASAPLYEMERLPLTTPPAELPQATLGTERTLPPARTPLPPWSERHPALFWGVLGGVLALLLLLIVRSMRGLKFRSEW